MYAWYSDPDANEFGYSSDTYQIIDALSDLWFAATDQAERDRLHCLAVSVRIAARLGNPYEYNLYMEANSFPKTGEPNSVGKLYNPDGSIKQERYYGPDGQPVKDIDYNHGGANHEFPHVHEWKNGVRSKDPYPLPKKKNELDSMIGPEVGGQNLGSPNLPLLPVPFPFPIPIPIF